MRGTATHLEKQPIDEKHGGEDGKDSASIIGRVWSVDRQSIKFSREVGVLRRLPSCLAWYKSWRWKELWWSGTYLPSTNDTISVPFPG